MRLVLMTERDHALLMDLSREIRMAISSDRLSYAGETEAENQVEGLEVLAASYDAGLGRDDRLLAADAVEFYLESRIKICDKRIRQNSDQAGRDAWREQARQFRERMEPLARKLRTRISPTPTPPQQ